MKKLRTSRPENLLTFLFLDFHIKLAEYLGQLVHHINGRILNESPSSIVNIDLLHKFPHFLINKMKA